MGRGMADQLGMIGGKHRINPRLIPHRANERHQIQFRMGELQLLLNGIGVVFVNIEDHQLLGMMLGNLSAQLTANGATAAGHQHNLASDVGVNFRQIRLNFIPAQQILHRHILQIVGGDLVSNLLDPNLTAGQLINAGQNLQFTVGFLTNPYDLAGIAPGGRGNGINNVRHMVVRRRIQNAAAISHHRDTAQQGILLGRVIVDDADHVVLAALTALELPQYHCACRTRADEHSSAHGNVVLPEHPPGDSVEIANQRQGQEQKQQIENRHTPGQIYAHDLADGDLCHRRSQGRENDISQLVNAGIAPQTLIQMKQRKEQNGDNGIHRRSFHHKFGLLQGRDAELKPHQQGRQRREVDGKQVENHQRQRTLAAHVIPFDRLFLH